MQIGRPFTTAEDMPPAPFLGAVISDRLWQSMFNGDPAVVGKTLQVNGLTATVVGVAPASFTGFTRGQRSDMWMSVSQFFTLRQSPDRLDSRESSWLSLIGRTRPGVAPC